MARDLLRKALVALVMVCAFAVVQVEPLSDSVGSNGGSTCIGCTLVVALLKQFMQVYDLEPAESIEYFCSLLPDMFHEACETIKGAIDVVIIPMLQNNDTADVACYTAGLCYPDPGHGYCHLFAVPEGGMEKAVKRARSRLPEKIITEESPFCKLPGLEDICNYFELMDINKNAKYDDDGDLFSDVENMRGYDWFGHDCSDSNNNAYPGRIPDNGDRDYDSNCNGIWGVNPDTQVPYEDELCQGTEDYGIIYIGDSIGAHFHIPPDWIRATVVSAELMENLTFIAGNELDWPHLSWGTGSQNVTWPVVLQTPTNSLYWRLRNRNQCAHRDYQNLAFNGARSDTAMDNLPNMTRDAGRDKPAIVVYAEFGNDICRSDTGSVDEMTQVENFTAAVLGELEYMNTRLPPGSHVILVGLVNGTYLYQILKGRLHPIGELNGDVTYDNLYDYFSCMQTVCPGWTNTNITEATTTTDHAYALSNALRQIAATANYSRFDVHYLDSPLDEAVAEWTGEPWELIEPVDGLHPSKHGQDLFAKVIWDNINEYFPEILGAVNPNNAKITEIFGDQGGT